MSGIYPPELTTIAAKIHSIRKRALPDAIEIGRQLKQARMEVRAYDQRFWLDWLKDEFDWSQKSASNFMRLAEMADSNPGLVNFTNLELSAAYVLVNGTTPEKARDEILARAEDGRVSHKVAREIVAAHKPERGKKPDNRPPDQLREALRVIALAAENSSPALKAPALADASELIKTDIGFLQGLLEIVGDPVKLATAQLSGIVAAETKADKLRYGKADLMRVMAAVAAQATPEQLQLLADGAYGRAGKVAVEQLTATSPYEDPQHMRPVRGHHDGEIVDAESAEE